MIKLVVAAVLFFASILYLMPSEKTYNPVGTWQWQYTQKNGENILEPRSAYSDSFSITFTSDGKVSGTTDCNGFFGTYTQSGENNLAFGSLASTLMYCEGAQETSYMNDISKVLSVRVENGIVLVLTTASGEEITFQKK